MRNMTVHTGTVADLTRLPSSRSGNPRFLVCLREDSGGYITARTAPDSSVGYDIKNVRDGERITLEIGTHYGCQQIRTLRRHATKG